jgi:GAF domain-containing protein
VGCSMSEPDQRELIESFAQVARALASQPDLDSTWRAIVRLGVASIPGTQDAGITTMRSGRFSTVAPSSNLPQRVDAIQYELRSGPCVDAVLERHTFRTGDLLHDERWPEFGRRAATEQGVLSMLSFRLFLEEDRTIGGLNLYSTERDAFDHSAELLGTVFATHAAIALAAAQRHQQVSELGAALQSNRDIGLAIGILMNRHLMTRDQAFDLMRMASQNTHRKLVDVARDVAERGELEFPRLPD